MKHTGNYSKVNPIKTAMSTADNCTLAHNQKKIYEALISIYNKLNK